MNNYRTFFGFNKEPFNAGIRVAEILKTPELIDIKDRFDYVLRLGAIGLITGEVGSGKTTTLRYALQQLHPSEYRSLYITASSGSIMEFYRQLLDALGIHISSNSKVVMVRMIKKEITDLAREKKMKILLIVDEASLMRLEVFAELHTICQFEKDASPCRVVAKSHLEGTDLAGMETYLTHHLAVAGVERMLFDPSAVTGIHQGSGGLFRKANHLARGALIAAAHDQSASVNAEHVRIASTEIF